MYKCFEMNFFHYFVVATLLNNLHIGDTDVQSQPRNSNIQPQPQCPPRIPAVHTRVSTRNTNGQSQGQRRTSGRYTQNRTRNTNVRPQPQPEPQGQPRTPRIGIYLQAVHTEASIKSISGSS